MVSTCNRTEIYFYGDDNDEANVKAQLKLDKGIDEEDFELIHAAIGEEAVQHLFNVSLGLDSKILGDVQIINQVKRSYQWSADEDMAGPYLHRLMHTIFFANKRVTQETDFRDGSGSVASVAVELIRTTGDLISDPRVLLIGTGEIGQNVLENLSDDFTDVTIINRTDERAKNLADSLNYRFASFEHMQDELLKADVVIAAVTADDPIIGPDLIRPSLTQRLYIDLSIPRAIESTIEKVQGVLLYNIDQIEERASEVLERRKRSVLKVEQILSDHLGEFHQWSKEMVVSPTIQLLKEKLEEIRQQEISRHLKKITESEAKLLDQVTKNMIQKVIKLPVLELKAACKRGEAETLVEALNDIFNLEGKVQKKS